MEIVPPKPPADIRKALVARRRLEVSRLTLQGQSVQQIATELGIVDHQTARLRDPAYNLDLGAAYLAAQLARFGNATGMCDHIDFMVYPMCILCNTLGFVMNDQSLLEPLVVCRNPGWAGIEMALQ